MKFRERIYRFMQGRYGAGGADAFTRFLSILTFVFILLSFFRVPFTYIIAIVLIVYMYFRLLSRNYYKRQQENFFARTKNHFKQLKTHHIYRCPTCRQKIRVPRGKGRIEIRCPKCGTKFIKKS